MKISKAIPSRSANPNNQFLGDFAFIASKLERVGPIFFNFQSMFILAIRCVQQRQETNIVSNNKTGLIFIGK